MINDPNKLSTILNNQLYAGYSSGFNDVFDSQVRLSDDKKRSLAMNILDASTINFHLELLHGINIACFSELDPRSVTSNYMWGHYGGSGLGVALCYNIDDLIAYAELDDFNINGCGFYGVAYDTIGYAQNYHIIKQFFEETISAELNKKTLPDMYIYIIIFLTSKTREWENEKEWRFVSLKNYPNHQNAHQYRDSTNALILIQETKQKDHKLFPFIKPAKLVFGWDNYKNKGWQQFAYTELEKWAKEQNVECVYLDDKLNYDNEKFNVQPERIVK